MRDSQDQKMKELVYRLIDMAPDAPRFPEEPMVESTSPVPARARRRSGPLAVAALAAVLVVGFVGSIIVLSNDPSGPPVTQLTTTSTTSTPAGDLEPLWPQTSLEEVRRAQERADAGDPDFTWQLGGEGWNQPALNHPNDSMLFTRFLEEVVGWEGSLWSEASAHPDGLVPGDVVFIRCAPGVTNPLYPTSPEGSGCAPTIDEVRYETVNVHVSQLVREGQSGIWVVTGWETIEPFEQVAPPSDAELTAFLGAFFEARIDGEGAEEFIDLAAYDPFAYERLDPEVPLLYATSIGSPYARAEFELVDGPVWPSGDMQLLVKLFTEADESVVEQALSLERDDSGDLRLVYDFRPMGPEGPLPATTENGEAVPVAYGFLNGEVTYRVAYPFEPSEEASERIPGRSAIVGLPFDGLECDETGCRTAPRTLRLLWLLADPRPIGPDCVVAPPAVDAAALAQSLQSDPDFEVTDPVAVTIGGTSALQIDVLLAPEASVCPLNVPDVSGMSPLLFEQIMISEDQLVRLYLVDLPGATERVLAIVVIHADVDQALELAAPIVESIEFHTP